MKDCGSGRTSLTYRNATQFPLYERRIKNNNKKVRACLNVCDLRAVVRGLLLVQTWIIRSLCNLYRSTEFCTVTQVPGGVEFTTMELLNHKVNPISPRSENVMIAH